MGWGSAEGWHGSRQKTAPAAWRHILLNGHYTFQSSGKVIDLDALVAGLELGYENFGGSGLHPLFVAVTNDLEARKSATIHFR
ncbi:hypothetical protein [Xanthomonas citri]|uniref:hypothetical protein n=1 Tax=Xanthomonas citri TaxID=346 RepID=UPI0005B3E1D6|nr:hypothetical protein [Xanthomonas citri]